MHSVIGFGINDTVVQLARLLDSKGIVEKNNRTDSEMLSLYNVTFKIHNPRDLYLNIPGRNSNIYALMAETIWVLSGETAIDPYLSFFLKRAKDFSDDGITWRGGYGKRLYNYDQLNSVIEKLKKDHTTRQAILSIYDPCRDSDEGLKKVYNLEKTVDLPCNNLLYFYITDGKLNLHVTQRSGDIIWGLGSINIFEWLTLQNIVASFLGIGVGYYTHYVNNLHVYKSNKLVYKQFKNIVNCKDILYKPAKNNIFSQSSWKNINNFSDYLKEIYKVLCNLIELVNRPFYIDYSIEFEISRKNIYRLLDKIIDCEFKTWIVLLYNYIIMKDGNRIKEQFCLNNICVFSEGLLETLKCSKFSPGA